MLRAFNAKKRNENKKRKAEAKKAEQEAKKRRKEFEKARKSADRARARAERNKEAMRSLYDNLSPLQNPVQLITPSNGLPHDVFEFLELAIIKPGFEK